ncbi:MAG: sulfite exporter TauE/SafE family protein [Oscillospiraceae bacterium]|nr:sulfite exporter TauE/SafE family protein [Oscillospiraceae bacterium]
MEKDNGKRKKTVKSASAGVGAGIICGLLGAGGGAVLVPLLRDWIGLDAKRAMATSVFCVAPLCAVSAAMYAASGKLPWNTAWPYALGGLIGGVIAGFLFAKTAPGWLRRSFGVLLLLGVVRQFFQWETGLAFDGVLPSAAAGAGTGVLSGFGLGGGVLLLIWMTAFGGLEQHAAQGSNLLYFPPCAIGSMVGHIKNKQIVWREGLWCIGAGLPAAFLGAFLATRLDAAPLRIGFGILTALIGLREVFFRKKEPVQDQ